ncbi:unnamed protein product [Caretta caretta]
MYKADTWTLSELCTNFQYPDLNDLPFALLSSHAVKHIEDSSHIIKVLILNKPIRSINFADYKTLFGGLLRLQECDAVSIVAAIKEFYKKHQLDLMKMVMFTSDGASVMLGKPNGMAAQLKRDIPHLVQQHCVAHREDLGISDAWKEVKLIRDIETLMRTVYMEFCQSSRRKCKFQETVDASECESVAFRPLSEVRWLSRHFALRAIIRNYNPLLEYFEQDKDTDPVSKYCHKKLNTMECRITLKVLNDVLSELASLSTLLQKRGLTLLEAFHLTQDRFPEDEVQVWSAFDCAVIVKCNFNFGIHQVKSLCSKYKDFLAEEIVIVNQYNDVKFAVAERIKSQ